MMAPTLVVMVRLLWLMVRHHRHELYWMVAELTFGKHGEQVVEKMLDKEARLMTHSSWSLRQEQPSQPTAWARQHFGIWNGPVVNGLPVRKIPEVRGKRVESQASRQTPDHHSRPQ
jgi:hypothetical protein